MNITIYLGSWLLPAFITIGAIIAGFIVSTWDGKSRGDYSVPIFSMMAVVGTCLVSITAWLVFFALKILG